MTLDYAEGENVKVSMIDYIDEIISAFDKAYPRGSEINTRDTSYYLYKVDEDCEKLSPDKAKMSYNIVAKNLYTTNQARPYTCTAVEFLTTRVKQPKKDECCNLSHLMKYIRGTRYIPLILITNASGVLK